MEAITLFLIKSIIVSGLLTCWYMIGLRGRRLHRYNRAFLLTILFASLAFPLIHFQVFNLPPAVTLNLLPVSLSAPETTVATSTLVTGAQPVQPSYSWPLIAGLLIAGVSLFLLIVLFARVRNIIRLCRQKPAMRIDGVNLIFTDTPKAPFTFLKYLFWNNTTPLKSKIGQSIYKHELAHIAFGHTYDKLLCQTLTCIFWFNPFFWIIQKELDIVHEFIADEQAVESGDTEAFALMLLQTYNSGGHMVPEHHFTASSVKRRLAMLQHTRPVSLSMLRQFAAVPVLALAIMLLACVIPGTAPQTVRPAKKNIVLMLDAGHGGKETGEQAGGFVEKDISLKYAKRIQQLAPAYNVDVQLTRNNDQDLELSERVIVPEKTHPDVFISLHLGDDPGKEPAKGDMDIYVSAENRFVRQSTNYSSAIFNALAQNNIIPGVAGKGTHIHSPTCGCNRSKGLLSVEKDGVYVLKHAQVPAMVLVLGNIKNKTAMQQLTSEERLEALSHAVLQGIVDGTVMKNRQPGNSLDILTGNDGEPKCR